MRVKLPLLMTALAFVSLTLTSKNAGAQTVPQLGIPPFSSVTGGPDQINLSNLSIHYTIPVFSRAGRGAPFSFVMNEDSVTWSQSYNVNLNQNQWTPFFPLTGGGLNGVGAVFYTKTPKTCTDSSNDQVDYNLYTFSSFQDSTGSTHGFGTLGLQLTDLYDNTGTCYSQYNKYPRDQANGNASDGSAIAIAVVLSPFAATVTTPHGDIIHAPLITYVNSWVATGSPYSWVDSNGNEITETLRAGDIGIATVTDNLGTVAITGAGTYPAPITYTYTAPSGAPAAYKQTFKQYTVQTAFNCPNVAEYPATTWNLLDKVYLPNTTYFYQFNYETSGTLTVTGRLKSVTLPTGGTINYTYTGGDTGKGIVCVDGSVSGLQRTTPDGIWQYTRSNFVDNATSVLSSTTTVTDPQTNQTVINFSANSETQRQIYTGTAGGTPLETVITCYNGNTTNCGTTTGVGGPPFNEIDVYRSLNGGSQARVDTKITAATGQVWEKDEYDFGLSTLSRKTAISYAALGNGIVDRPSLVTVTDGGGNLLSQTGYTYDGDAGSLQYSGASQLVGVTCVPTTETCRGNATTVKSYINTSSYLTKTFTHYDTGQVYTATDANSAVTTYTYGGCNHSLLTGVAMPLTLTNSYAWSCDSGAKAGGVVIQATDANNQSAYTNYTTDAYFWRPESTKDQSFPPNVTSLTYTGLTRVESVLPVIAGSSNVDIVKTVDTLGRPSLSQTRQTPSSSTYDTAQQTYDSDGRPYHVTMPCAAALGTGCTTPQTTTLYDGMGRVVTSKDGSGTTVTTTTYSNNDVNVDVTAPTGENDKQRQMEYDGLGRLKSVCEIVTNVNDPYSGPCQQTNGKTGYWTQYSYSGTTLTVTQNTQKTPVQTRTYTYDALGRLTLESNPETGTTQYFYDSAPSTPGVSCPAPTTSNGDLVKKYDAQGNTICYQYDALHRLTAVLFPGGPDSGRSVQKHFVYDSTLVSSYSLVNTLGRLSEAYTGPSTGKITDLGFSYSSRGEVSDVYENTPHSGGWYHVSAVYFPHGLLNTLNTGISGMPTIYFGGNNCSSCLDGEGRLLQVTASTGQNLVGFNGNGVTYATSGTTQPISSLTKVTYGSGDFDSFSYDTNTGRMTQYQFSVGATPQTDTGGLTWNANGSLKTLAITDQLNPAENQTCGYSYDDLGRTSSATCTYQQTTVWQQTFTYDPFGNNSKTGSSAFMPTYTSNPSTNQYYAVSSCANGQPSYNLNGDPTNDCEHQYTWNADNRPTTIDTSNSYTYDALGRLVELVYTGGNTEYLYSPTGQSIALMNGQALQKAMFRLPGGGTAIYKNGTPPLNHYRHGDWLGSARLSTTPSQTLYYDVAYAPFGETYSPLIGSGGNTSVAFGGQGKDTTTDLYPFLFRQYNSIQSRWVWPDPSGLGAVSMENPQSWNRYAYVGNGPLNTVDPSGLRPWDKFDDSTGASGCEGPDCSTTYLNGVQVSQLAASALLSAGAAALCPGGVCNGFNQRGQYLQYWAFATGGGYYAYVGPGALYYSAQQAGIAAVQFTDPMSIKKNKEYSGNLYEDQNGVYSYTTPDPGHEDDSPFNPRNIPAGTTYVGSYHDHGAFLAASDENFSPNGCNGGHLCDLGLAMSRLNPGGAPFFLGTPSGRVEVFYPSQAGSLPFGCVLVGSAVPGGNGARAVPTCR